MTVMSDSIVPGVTLMNKYDTPRTSSQGFSNYLNYISRENAVSPKDFQQYLDYMDNPAKQANLFTDDQDFLTLDEKDQWKERFSQTEKQNGVMWETVISFHNPWLEEHGLYDSQTGWVDEQELKRLTRGAMKRIETEDNLQLSWTGAIHHNTDNIHIHIASVERVPRQREKEYQIVEFPESWLRQHKVLTEESLSEMKPNVRVTTSKAVRGSLVYRDTMSRLKQAVLDETGRPFFCRNQMEFTDQNTIRVSLSQNAGAIPKEAKVIGTYHSIDATFREKTMNQAKSYIVHEVIRDQDSLQKINGLIRESIVKPTREEMQEFLQQDEALARDFMKLYHDLTVAGISRRDWSYGISKINPYRDQIDHIGDEILKRHFPEERDELFDLIHSTAEEYRKGLGDTKKGNEYEDNRMADLKKRLGNAVLSGLRNYDKERGREPTGIQRQREPTKRSKSKTTKPKRPSAPKRGAGLGGTPPNQALQIAIRQMEWDIRRAMQEGAKAEREQVYQMQQDVSEEVRAEQQRIRQGELDAMRNS